MGEREEQKNSYSGKRPRKRLFFFHSELSASHTFPIAIVVGSDGVLADGGKGHNGAIV